MNHFTNLVPLSRWTSIQTKWLPALHIIGSASLKLCRSIMRARTSQFASFLLYTRDSFSITIHSAMLIAYPNASHWHKHHCQHRYQTFTTQGPRSMDNEVFVANVTCCNIYKSVDRPWSDHTASQSDRVQVTATHTDFESAVNRVIRLVDQMVRIQIVSSNPTTTLRCTLSSTSRYETSGVIKNLLQSRRKLPNASVHDLIPATMQTLPNTILQPAVYGGMRQLQRVEGSQAQC